jgi:hypothetical protein
VKVSKLLAHRIHSEISIAIGLIETENYQRAIKVLERLSKLTADQTVVTVENCEECSRLRLSDEKKKAPKKLAENS